MAQEFKILPKRLTVMYGQCLMFISIVHYSIFVCYYYYILLSYLSLIHSLKMLSLTGLNAILLIHIVQKPNERQTQLECYCVIICNTFDHARTHIDQIQLRAFFSIGLPMVTLNHISDWRDIDFFIRLHKYGYKFMPNHHHHHHHKQWIEYSIRKA